MRWQGSWSPLDVLPGRAAGGSGSDRAREGPNSVRSENRRAAPAVDFSSSRRQAVDREDGDHFARSCIAEPALLGKATVSSSMRIEDATVSQSARVGEGVGQPGGKGARHDEQEPELRQLVNELTRDLQKELKDIEGEIMNVVLSLGASKREYLKERRRGMRCIVSEIYSPPRVTAATKLLPELRCVPGFALDLTTTDERGRRWDFDDADTRERARALLRAQKPMLLIGSPMCTAFSSWQNINSKFRDPRVVEQELSRARVHLEFCIELYREQLNTGRLFLHEHPAGASSWQEEAMKKLAGEVEVLKATADQCQY